MKRINNMQELKMAQVELRHKRSLKEMELQAQADSIKGMLNPMTYINYAVSKVTFLEQFAASFMKGYDTVRELVQKYRRKKEPAAQPPAAGEEFIPDNQ